MKRLLSFLLLLSLLVPLSACSFAAKCDVEKYKTTVDPLAKQWDDAVKLADQTPRSSLAAQISELQSIERDTEAVEVDECLKAAHNELLQSMTATVDGFLAFLGQEQDSKVTAHFQNADLHLSQWKSMVAAAAK